VQRLCSVAEPAQRHALRISAISCAGTVGIGLCTDPDALGGIAELAEAIDAALAELGEAAISTSR
jgi:diacylglycerol O-acyltransferase / wax synthase